jgi:hypothetical protein
MKKTYLKDTTILSVYDFQNSERKLLGKFLFGIVINDETNRFKSGVRVITSTIQSQDYFEFITKSGNYYVINDEPKTFDLSFAEFIVMRHGLYSISEILEMRQMLKLKDDRTIH